MGDILRGNLRCRPGPVLDHDLLTEARLRRLGKEPPDDIGRRPGRETDDEVDRTRRISLRPGEARQSRERGSTCCQLQKPTAPKCHGFPLWFRPCAPCAMHSVLPLKE